MRQWMWAAAVAAVLAWSGAAAAETVAVTAMRMIDVVSGKVVEHPIVVITDGRITAVGVQGQLAPPPDANVIDLPGETLLPGLIDMHVHLDSVPQYGGYSYLQFTDSFWPIVGTSNAKADLMAGFTTVRNVGSDNYNDVGLMQAVDEGVIEGPRIVPASYLIGSTGGHCDDNVFPPSMRQTNPGVADTPDEGVKMVRTVHKYGAQVIKICATGGVFSHGDTPGAEQMTYETMKAIADEAHRLGLRVAAHAHGADGIKDAIRAGVDTIEHASLVDDEGIALAKARGAWFDMDIYNTDYTQAEGAKNDIPEDQLKKDRDIGQIQRDNFRKALKAGVKMIFGTDAGVYPHGMNAKQFKIMVEYGMTPMQAIQAATVNAADALGRTSDVGAIAVGRYGDLIAVEENPLEDITALEQVDFVMKGGQVVKRGE